MFEKHRLSHKKIQYAIVPRDRTPELYICVISVCVLYICLPCCQEGETSTRNPSLRSEEKYQEKKRDGREGWGKIKGQRWDKDEETDKQSKRKKKQGKGMEEMGRGSLLVRKRAEME